MKDFDYGYTRVEKIKKMFLIIVIILIIALGVILFISVNYQSKKDNLKNQEKEIQTEPKEENSPIRIEKNMELGEENTEFSSNQSNITYQSSDEKVVKVTEDGTIKAVGVGTATVTIKKEAEEKNIVIYVKENYSRI